MSLLLRRLAAVLCPLRLSPSVPGVVFLRDLESYARESFLSFDFYSCFSSLAVLLQKGNSEMLAQGVVMVSKTVIQ